jgi:zinc finger CCHC domain-containing protein 9
MPRKTFVPSAAEEARQPSPEAGPSTAPATDDAEKPKKKLHRSGKKLKAIENGEVIVPDPLTLEEEREKQQARNQAKADKQKRKDTGETGAGYIQPEGDVGEGGTKRKGWGRDEGIASE